MIDDFKQKYNQLNKSFKKKCVFSVGHSAGFFSEINNMIFAMVYCLENKIKFMPYFKEANFSNEKGWQEFFEPFCEEFEYKIKRSFNYRTDKPSWKKPFVNLKAALFKARHGIDYLTYDLWPYFFNIDFLDGNRKIDIKELNIKGSIFSDASNQLADMIWKFNPQTKNEIDKIISYLNLPEKYISMHVRAGDKINEVDKLLEEDLFMNEIKKISSIKNIFVFADDYRQVEKLKKDYPDYSFYTLCGENEKGYVNDEFQKKNWQERRQGLLNLFANVEVCIKSNLFIGTIQANPDYFIRFLKDSAQVHFIQIS